MTRERRHLQKALRRLARAKKSWQLDYPNPDTFWPAYRGAAQIIADSAALSDLVWVEEQIEELMEGH
jgi:hypothetical protein